MIAKGAFGPVWFGVLWLGAMMVLGALYLTVPVSPDQALFDYIAWSHLQGDRYYVGVAEQNFPGKMLIHELGIRLFGVHFWTFRAVDFLILLAVTLGGAALLRKSGLGWGGVAFMWLYPGLYVTSGLWMAGQRDIMAAGFLLLAALAASGPVTDKTRLQMLGAGLMVATAVLIRPTYLSYLVGLAALVWLRFPGEASATLTQKVRADLWLAVGFFGLVLVVVGAGAWIGALDDFYQQTVLFNVEAYQVAGARSRLIPLVFNLVAQFWHWVAGLAVFGLGLWLIAAGLNRAVVLVLGLGMTVLVSYFAQNKGFGYHLGGLLPVITLLAAVGIDQLVARRGKAQAPLHRAVLTAVLGLVLLLCLGGTAKKLSTYSDGMLGVVAGQLAPLKLPGEWAEDRAAVDLIRAGSGPQDYVLQWGRNFHLPYLAERRSSIRFVSSPALTVMTPAFSGYEAWLAELRQSLEDKPPRFAVLDPEAIVPEGGRIVPRPAATPAEQLVMGFLADYIVVQQTPRFLVLRQP